MKNYSKYFTPQVDENDCGVAAFSSILKFYGSTYSLAKLRKMTRTSKYGTSALSIVQAAIKLGFHSFGVKSNLKQIQNQGPFIAQIITKNGFSHFIVVFNISKKTITISDPDSSTGISKISIQSFNSLWTGIAIIFRPTNKYIVFHEKSKSHINYIDLLRKNIKSISLITILSIIILIIEVIGAYFSQVLLNKLIPHHNISLISSLAFILIFSYLLQQTISYLQGMLTTKLYVHLAKNIILDFIQHIFSLPLTFFQTRTTGDITSRINDSYEIISSFSKLTVSLFINLITVLGLTIILFLQDHELFFLSMIIVPIYSLIFYLFFKPFKLQKKNVLEQKAIFDSKMIETIRGIETIKALNAENQLFAAIHKQFNNFMAFSVKFSQLELLQQSIKIGVSSILNIAILALGSAKIIYGSLTIGQLITFNILLNFFSESFQQIIGLQSELQTAKVSNNRLNEIFLLHEERTRANTKQDGQLLGEITVKNLTYHYPSNNKGIYNISFSIPFGKKIAIVGASGSGKTTLGKILSGLYQVSQGNILYDNYSFNDLSLYTVRNLVQYVPQSSILFKGTIMDNLLYGLNKNIPIKKIIRICELVDLKKDIDTLPQKFNTFVAENGTSLSGGQKQRIALARALLSDSKILILDESTSSLDKLTEQKVIKNLFSLKNKTIIFIAHHMSIAKKADEILLLKNGNLIETGTHIDLLKSNEYYRLLNQM